MFCKLLQCRGNFFVIVAVGNIREGLQGVFPLFGRYFAGVLYEIKGLAVVVQICEVIEEYSALLVSDKVDPSHEFELVHESPYYRYLFIAQFLTVDE